MFLAALNEVGIYRVSGVTSDVQNLKKLFDKSKTAFTIHSLYNLPSLLLLNFWSGSFFYFEGFVV